MSKMDERILDYLKTQRVCVLAVEMLDGSPHAATVHFAYSEDPLMFYFETNRDYRKVEPLFGKDVTRASLVVGVDESNKKTLQLDGEVRLIKPEEKETYDNIYFGKFPEKKRKSEDTAYVAFTFIPKWWRFSDFTVVEGKLILTSVQ